MCVECDVPKSESLCDMMYRLGNSIGTATAFGGWLCYFTLHKSDAAVILCMVEK